jgi:hypothetical protein
MFSLSAAGHSATGSSMTFMSAFGMLKKVSMLSYSISTIRSIVASPQKLHHLSSRLPSNQGSTFAVSVTHISLLIAYVLSP